MNDVPAATIKKIQTLAQIAADLRQGKDFNITRLTILKSLCADPDAAAQFALHVAKKTHQSMKRPGSASSKKQQQYQLLAAKAVRQMTAYLKNSTKEAERALRDTLSEVRSIQDRYEHQRWGPVRIIESMELLRTETALECVLHPCSSSDLGYRLARQYAERYSSRHGTGLIPKSAPFVEDIAEFWGRHFLGRGWKKRLAN
jgi:hypothetical protein